MSAPAIRIDDLAKGRFTIKDKDGKIVQFGQGDLAKVPSWVPRYPGAIDETSAMQAEEPAQTSGMLTFTTRDSSEDVGKFFDTEAGKLSLNSSNRSSYSLNGDNTLSVHYAAGKREITLNSFAKSGEATNVQIYYIEKK